MTNLEKQLVTAIINHAKKMDDFNNKFCKLFNLGETSETKITDFNDELTKPIFEHIAKHNGENSLGYFWDYNAKTIIKVMEDIENRDD